jgi:hypothetical protein
VPKEPVWKVKEKRQSIFTELLFWLFVLACIAAIVLGSDIGR